MCVATGSVTTSEQYDVDGMSPDPWEHGPIYTKQPQDVHPMFTLYLPSYLIFKFSPTWSSHNFKWVKITYVCLIWGKKTFMLKHSFHSQ